MSWIKNKTWNIWHRRVLVNSYSNLLQKINRACISGELHYIVFIDWFTIVFILVFGVKNSFSLPLSKRKSAMKFPP